MASPVQARHGQWANEDAKPSELFRNANGLGSPGSPANILTPRRRDRRSCALRRCVASRNCQGKCSTSCLGWSASGARSPVSSLRSRRAAGPEVVGPSAMIILLVICRRDYRRPVGPLEARGTLRRAGTYDIGAILLHLLTPAKGVLRNLKTPIRVRLRKNKCNFSQSWRA